MTNLGQMSVGELVSTLKDIGFFVAFVIAGWKARAIVQPAIDFFVTAKATMERANEHFVIVEEGLETLLTNHVAHIEADIAKLAGRDITHQDQIED